MHTPTISDSRNLTLSPREMENAQAQTLLSCLSDRLDDKQNLNLDKEEENKAKDLEEISLPELTRLSRTSEIRKWPKSRLFTKSCELPKRQMSMSKSDKQPLTTMPLRSTSLMVNDEAPNNEANMQHSWLESAMRLGEPPQGSQIEIDLYEEKPNEKNQMKTRPADSCESFAESSRKSVDNIAQPTLLARMMTPPQPREKGIQIRRNAYTNHSFRGTRLRPVRRTVKSTRTERRQGKSSEFFNETSPLQSEMYETQPLLHKDSQTLSGDTSSVAKQSISTSSLAISTTLPLLRRMLATSEEQKSLLEAQIQYERSKRVAIGQPPGTRPSKRLCTLSHTEMMSCDSGETISLWALAHKSTGHNGDIMRIYFKNNFC
jgi:hypothetical protein